MNQSKILVGLAILVLFAVVTGCGAQSALTVPEVMQNADRLDGKTIRVRGLAYLWGTRLKRRCG